MQQKRRATAFSWILPLAGVLSSACSSQSPDVVATSRPPDASVDAGFTDVQLINGCRPGHYRGNFYSDSGADASISLGIKGTIEFSLVETISGENLVIQSDNVHGVSDAGDSFDARVLGAGTCVEGRFAAELLGVFVPKGAASDAATCLALGTCISIQGAVSGDYVKYIASFQGTWSVKVGNGQSTVSGGWDALWDPS